MAFFDWDHNGKIDVVDDFIEYNIYRDVMGEDESDKVTYDSLSGYNYDGDYDNYSYDGDYDYSSSSYNSSSNNSSAYDTSDKNNYTRSQASELSNSVLDTREGVILCAIIALVINISIFKDTTISSDASLTFMLVVWLIISFVVAAIIDLLK